MCIGYSVTVCFFIWRIWFHPSYSQFAGLFCRTWRFAVAGPSLKVFVYYTTPHHSATTCTSEACIIFFSMTQLLNLATANWIEWILSSPFALRVVQCRVGGHRRSSYLFASVWEQGYFDKNRHQCIIGDNDHLLEGVIHCRCRCEGSWSIYSKSYYYQCDDERRIVV